MLDGILGKMNKITGRNSNWHFYETELVAMCVTREKQIHFLVRFSRDSIYMAERTESGYCLFFCYFSVAINIIFLENSPPLKHVAGKDGEVFAISQICARFTTINRISPTSIQIQVRRSSGGDFLTCCGYSIYGHSLASALLLFFPTKAIVKKSIPYNFTILLTCLGDNI